MRARWIIGSLFAAAAALPACADPDAGGADPLPDAGTGEPGACPSDSRVGGLKIDVRADYPAMSAEYADGVVPAEIWFAVDGGAIGDCFLEQRFVPICDEICGPTETCDHDGTCIPYPTSHSVGTIAVTGLYEEISIEPVGADGAEMYSYVGLEYPFFDPGDGIVAQASGDAADFGGFTLAGRGVELIDLLDEEPILLKEQDLQVDWTPGQIGASVQFLIKIDQHGQSPIRLVCETADTGGYTIPAALVDWLIGAGVTGYPSLTIARRTVERTASPDVAGGCIDFEVVSALTRTILVEDHIPCQGDWECPEGMVCDEAIQTCVAE
jgi:hypothetical protein